MQVTRVLLATLAFLGLASEASAGGLFSTRPGSDGWGVVPGIRYGAVHGTFDGAGMESSAWGTTTEVHVDFMHTLGHDRYGAGLSIGYHMQGHDSAGTDSFGHDGTALTGFLTKVIGGRNSGSLRFGRVSGSTETGAGPINAPIWRIGGQATHVFTVSYFDLATSGSLEYFTGSDAGRGYQAIALVLGLTVTMSSFPL